MPARMSGSSIGDALGGHRNSLGVLRLVLAGLVIFDHAFPLGGFGEDPFWRYTSGQTSLGGIAVGGFFAISGYLIIKSGASADIVQFLWRRAIRIFPAFWGVLLVAACIVGPLAWRLSGRGLRDYFSFHSDGPWGYIASNWTLQINRYGIYDIFLGTPYGEQTGASVFNGSLWTLWYEWGCYMMVAVLAIAGVLARARVLVVVLAFLVFAVKMLAAVDAAAPAVILPLFGDPQVLFLASAFLCGAVLGIYSDRIPFADGLGVASGALFVVSLFYGGFAIIGIPCGAYFLLYLAARLPRSFQWIGARNDYSYGVYVYGFLVQQCLAALGVHRWGYLPFAFAAIPITFGLAWLSWHLIEKRALALKSWGPGRGIAYWSQRTADRRHARTDRRQIGA